MWIYSAVNHPNNQSLYFLLISTKSKKTLPPTSSIVLSSDHADIEQSLKNHGQIKITKRISMRFVIQMI